MKRFVLLLIVVFFQIDSYPIGSEVFFYYYYFVILTLEGTLELSIFAQREIALSVLQSVRWIIYPISILRS